MYTRCQGSGGVGRSVLEMSVRVIHCTLEELPLAVRNVELSLGSFENPMDLSNLYN